ncbi:MAG: hypothetical protein J6W29_00295 [Neisseriaceae bacterium]|nr:hypothetical protein [Neisseriaceae bacterium]
MKKNSLFKTLFDIIQESLGYPASLYTLIENCPDISMPLDEPKFSISLIDSIISWHEWKWNPSYKRKIGEVMGCCGHYTSYNQVLTELSNFTDCNIIENWKGDIQDIVGICFSKSKLDDFDTFDKMVKENAPEMITPVTVEKLNQNLAHRGIDIIHNKKTSNHFEQYMWDGRIFLSNHDGSHHFAAARYIAYQLNTPVPLIGKLYIYSINEQSVISLCNKYEIFTIEMNYFVRFSQIMKNFSVPFMWYPLPQHNSEKYYENHYVIFLPKNNKKSIKMATILHKSNFFDFGRYLRDLVERQNRNIKQQYLQAA